MLLRSFSIPSRCIIARMLLHHHSPVHSFNPCIPSYVSAPSSSIYVSFVSLISSSAFFDSCSFAASLPPHLPTSLIDAHPPYPYPPPPYPYPIYPYPPPANVVHSNFAGATSCGMSSHMTQASGPTMKRGNDWTRVNEEKLVHTHSLLGECLC
jgi:hypothetical protein